MSFRLGGGGDISGMEINPALKRLLQKCGLQNFEVRDGPLSGNRGVIIVWDGTRELVVKRFPEVTLDSRLRWLREFRFLAWANSNDVSPYVPTLINQAVWGGLVIEEYIAGKSVTEPSKGNYITAARFYRALVEAGEHRFIPNIRSREYLGSADRLQRQLLTRRHKISKVALMFEDDEHLAPLFSVFTSYSDSQISTDSRDTFDFSNFFSTAIGTDSIVSPSDFGFHNFIETDSSGSGKFIDFEYAGTDHPLKGFMDFLMQPEFDTRTTGANTFSKALGLPDGFAGTVPSAAIRIFALKWAAIVSSRMLLNSTFSSSFGSHYLRRLRKYEEMFRSGFE